MRMRATFNITHWMVGISFGDRYHKLVSIGPLNFWFHNERRYKRDMENHMLRNTEVGAE